MSIWWFESCGDIDLILFVSKLFKMLYDDFKPIVDLVLNNWTALQLAVEHGMGAPGGEKVIENTLLLDII